MPRMTMYRISKRVRNMSNDSLQVVNTAEETVKCCYETKLNTFLLNLLPNTEI